jgi:golgi SNAP receptor complex member 2
MHLKQMSYGSGQARQRTSGGGLGESSGGSEGGVAGEFPQVQRLLHEAAGLLERLLSGDEGKSVDEGTVARLLNECARKVHALEEQVPHENPARRQVWRQRVKGLRQRSEAMRSELDRFYRQRHEQNSKKERDELIGRRARQAGGGVEALQKEQIKVNAAADRVTDMLELGSAVLEDLTKSRSVFKSAHAKALNVMNWLGLSDTVLRMSQRREKQDQMLVYGGMLVTTLIIGALIYYFIL